MIKDDLKEMLIEKREARNMFIKEYILVYIKAILTNNFELASKIKNTLMSYLEIERNETKIIKLINNMYGDLEDSELVDEIFIELDNLFFMLYDYYDNALNGFDDAIETKEMYRSTLPKKPQLLDENKRLELEKKLKL